MKGFESYETPSDKGLLYHPNEWQVRVYDGRTLLDSDYFESENEARVWFALLPIYVGAGLTYKLLEIYNCEVSGDCLNSEVIEEISTRDSLDMVAAKLAREALLENANRN